MNMVEEVEVGPQFVDRASPNHRSAQREQLEQEEEPATTADRRRDQVVDQDEAQEERHGLHDVRSVQSYPTWIRDLRRERRYEQERQRAVEDRSLETDVRVDQERHHPE